MQKWASGGAAVPQLSQRRSSLAPQHMQKRAPAGFSVPQAAQLTTSRLARPRRSPYVTTVTFHRDLTGVAVDLGHLGQQRRCR